MYQGLFGLFGGPQALNRYHRSLQLCANLPRPGYSTLTIYFSSLRNLYGASSQISHRKTKLKKRNRLGVQKNRNTFLKMELCS
jgi:hypothetical protein